MSTTQYDYNLLLSLRNIGFSEHQALVYLATLELGKSSIWDIAEHSGIKRPTCYDVLEELAIKGLASSSFDGKRILYSVSSPQQLLLHEEKRHNQILAVANTLEAMASSEPEKPEFRQYIGREGVQEAFNLLFLEPKGTELLIYGSLAFEKDYEEFLNDYAKQRVKKDYPARLLYSDTPAHREILKKAIGNKLIKTRFISASEFEFKTHEVCIFGDTIAYLAHSEKEPFATVLKSTALTKGEKQLFEFIWRRAKP